MTGIPGQEALFGGPRPSSLTAEQGAVIDRLARGEAVPGARGACASCHHARVWHAHADRNHPCGRCQCISYAPRLDAS